MKFGLRGPSFAISSACASAAHAIGEAYWMIKSGRCRAAVTGGAEAPLTYGGLVAWQGIRVMSNDACRPFSANRSGMILGEGAGTLVLERLEDAKARGATIYGEIAAVGISSDAGDIVDPSADGAGLAIKRCLQELSLIHI